MIRLKKIIFTLLVIGLVLVASFIQPTVTIDSADKLRDFELPKFYFEGNLENMTSKKDEREIKVKYVSNEEKFTAYAKIKPQGTSSMMYWKKNYTINLYKDETLDEKYKVDFGWGKQNKYCLKANWIDKTHARNIVTARIAADVQKKYNLFTNTPHFGTIDGTPVEIYINGEFHGLYTLNIPKDAWMFNMDEENKNHIVLSGNNGAPGNLFTGSASFDDWEVEVGEESQETLDKLNRIVDFVRFSSDEEFRKNISKYFNLDSLLNYYVMMQFAQLNDNVCKNMLLVTYDGKVWYTSLYDLDTSWGSQWNGIGLANYNMYTVPSNSGLWQRVEKLFSNELADRYFELRKDILTVDNVKNEFKKFNYSIPVKSFEKEHNKWSNIPGYDLPQIDDFLEVRVPLVDKYFTDLYTYESKVTVVYKRNSNGTVTAKLKNVRNDIIVVGDDEFTFKENGTYTFCFTKFLGDRDFIVAEAKGVKYKFGA